MTPTHLSINGSEACPGFMFLARTIIAILIAITGMSNAYSAEPSDPMGAGRWESLGALEGVKLARKSIRGNNLFAVRGESVIPHSMDRVATVINDHTRWKEWAHGMISAQLLERANDGTKIVYQAFDMPLLVSDRDTVYSFAMTWEGDRLKILGQSVPHPKAPPTVGIRTNLIAGRWFLEPMGPQKTHLVLEVLMDPKGSLPSWLVNIVQRDYPADTINQLKAQLHKPDIRTHPLPPRAAITN